MKSILALLILASPAMADCQKREQLFMSCQIENSANVLRVCFTPDTVHYRYGPRDGAPDLALSVPVATVDYRPWPGVGRAIFEEITFTNLNYSYVVVAGFERMFDDEAYEDIPHRSFGGVVVRRDGQDIANLNCERPTVAFDWATELFEAKQALGYSWNDRDREWVELPD